MKKKLIRITTVPVSMSILLKGQLSFMKNYFEVICISSEGDELCEVANREGVNIFSINMTRYISPIADIISAWKMYKLFLLIKPDIVHTHTPKAGIVGMLAAKLANVPIRIHTVAGLPLIEHKGVKRVLLNFVEKLTYYFAIKVYPNSKGLYDFILANKFTSVNKLKILSNGSSNGIDTSYFDPSIVSAQSKNIAIMETGIGIDDFAFIFIGRLVKSKGINELVSAFTELNLTNCKLILVGSYENDLDPLDHSTINQINDNSNIIHVGFKNDVRSYFAICDCLVFPSYREGFPNVVMQAGAMKLPSIVSDINGCNEIITHEENGLIIPTKDVESLKVALQKIINDRVLYEKCKENAREIILTKFKQDLIWKALLEEYNILIHKYSH